MPLHARAQMPEDERYEIHEMLACPDGLAGARPIIISPPCAAPQLPNSRRGITLMTTPIFCSAQAAGAKHSQVFDALGPPRRIIQCQPAADCETPRYRGACRATSLASRRPAKAHGHRMPTAGARARSSRRRRSRRRHKRENVQPKRRRQPIHMAAFPPAPCSSSNAGAPSGAARHDEGLAFARRDAKLPIGHGPVLQDLDVALANRALTLGGFVNAFHFSDSRIALMNLK